MHHSFGPIKLSTIEANQSSIRELVLTLVNKSGSSPFAGRDHLPTPTSGITS